MAGRRISAYYGGYLGGGTGAGREFGGPHRLRRVIERVVGGVNWLMQRWGMADALRANRDPESRVRGGGADGLAPVRMPRRRFFVFGYGGQRSPG